MAGEVLFIGWGSVIPGREQRALDLFQEVMAYNGRLQQEGRIESFEACVLGPHGGDLDGFMMLRGERTSLAQIRFDEEFERLIARATGLLNRVGVIPAYTGEALGRLMGVFQEVAAELES